MGKYNIGDVWWTHFPFENSNIVKHRPAIVINDDEIAILAMYVTSKDKETPYSIEITDWEQPYTMMQLYHMLEEETGWSKSTVVTMLGRMVDKGLIAYSEERGKHRFEHRWSEV